MSKALQTNRKQQTEGEGKIYAILLIRLCDIVAPQALVLRTSMRKAKLSG